jgi:hypothetical protein
MSPEAAADEAEKLLAGGFLTVKLRHGNPGHKRLQTGDRRLLSFKPDPNRPKPLKPAPPELNPETRRLEGFPAVVTPDL